MINVYESRLIIALLILTMSFNIYAAKTDIIILTNGDRLTGEIKGMDKGKLELSTDYMGTIYIDWLQIVDLISRTGQTVELNDGTRIYGPIVESESNKLLVQDPEKGPVIIDNSEVFIMYPVESNFWDRVDINASAGVSWDKGSSVGKFSFGLGFEMRDPQYLTRASLVTEITSQQEGEDTTRTKFDSSRLKFRKNKRFSGMLAEVERNDELDINMRVLAGGIYGSTVIRDQSNRLIIGGGLAATHEIPQTGDAVTSIESLGYIGFDYFRYTSPERTLTSVFKVFPSITQFGRVRANFDTTFNLEMVSDLFWKLSFYASYDSEPQSIGATRSDFGVNSSFAYEF